MTSTNEAGRQQAKSTEIMNLIVGIFLVIAGLVFIALHFSLAPFVGPVLGVVMLIVGVVFIRKRNKRLQ